MQDSSDPRTARFHTPSGLAFDKQVPWSPITGNHVIRRISPKGEVS